MAQGDHHTIYVYDEGGSRYLSFSAREKRIQTRVDLSRPGTVADAWVASLAALVATHPCPRRVLVLGAGGGVLPMTLRKVIPEAQIEAVDHDAAVLHAARVYFGLELDDRLKLHAMDARAFIAQSHNREDRYDVIVLDVFDDDYIPAHLMTVEFLAEMRNVLADRGLLVANTFGPAPLRQREFASYAQVYGNFGAIAVGWNRILLAGEATARIKEHCAHAPARRMCALALAGVDASAVIDRIKWVSAGACTGMPITDAEIGSRELEVLREQAIARSAPSCWDALAAALVKARVGIDADVMSDRGVQACAGPSGQGGLPASSRGRSKLRAERRRCIGHAR